MKEPNRNLLNFIFGWVLLLEGFITICTIGFYRPGLELDFCEWRLNRSTNFMKKKRENESKNYNKKTK
jgi:hypothetical protein